MSWCTLPMLLLRPAYCSGIQPPIILITSTYTPKASINSMEPQNDNFQHKSPFPEADRRPQNEATLPSQMLRWDPTVQHPQYTNYSWWLQSIWTLDIQCDTIGTSDVLIQRSEWSCHLNTKYIYIYIFCSRYWYGFQAGNVNGPAPGPVVNCSTTEVQDSQQWHATCCLPLQGSRCCPNE